MGVLGPIAFVSALVLAECIPFFPTQPFLLVSGLLFGTWTGALSVLTANSLAGILTFYLARGLGRPYAERLLGSEGAGPLAQRAQQLQGMIEKGGFWSQTGTIFLLRMTPVIPYRHVGAGRGVGRGSGNPGPTDKRHCSTCHPCSKGRCRRVQTCGGCLWGTFYPLIILCP